MMLNNYKKTTIMKVQVNLTIPRNVELDKTFVLWPFESIEIKAIAPECPFCGTLLYQRLCSCKKFKTSSQKLLSTYSGQGLFFVLKNGEQEDISYPIAKENVTQKRVPLTDEMILLFDRGAVVPSYCGQYFVSEGIVEGSELTFYVRQKGNPNVYECRVKGIDDIPREAKIRLCRHNISLTKEKTTFTEIHPSGDHRGNVGILRQELMTRPSLSRSTGKGKISSPRVKVQQETIAEFGYGEFSAHLQELMNDKE